MPAVLCLLCICGQDGALPDLDPCLGRLPFSLRLHPPGAWTLLAANAAVVLSPGSQGAGVVMMIHEGDNALRCLPLSLLLRSCCLQSCGAPGAAFSRFTVTESMQLIEPLHWLGFGHPRLSRTNKRCIFNCMWLSAVPALA